MPSNCLEARPPTPSKAQGHIRECGSKAAKAAVTAASVTFTVDEFHIILIQRLKNEVQFAPIGIFGLKVTAVLSIRT